jgi:hypothetical protein
VADSIFEALRVARRFYHEVERAQQHPHDDVAASARERYLERDVGRERREAASGLSACNRGDFDGVLQYLDPDVELHPGVIVPDSREQYRGRQGL